MQIPNPDHMYFACNCICMTASLGFTLSLVRQERCIGCQCRLSPWLLSRCSRGQSPLGQHCIALSRQSLAMATISALSWAIAVRSAPHLSAVKAVSSGGYYLAVRATAVAKITAPTVLSESVSIFAFGCICGPTAYAVDRGGSVCVRMLFVFKVLGAQILNPG